MRISYENTVEDMVAFSRNYFDSSPSVRSQVRSTVWTIVVLVVAGSTGIAVFADAPRVLLIGGVLAIWWAIWVPGNARRAYEQSARKTYSGSDMKGIIGPHELELVGDELVERTPFGEMRTRLGAIDRVVSTDQHTFIYVTSVMAHVIPHFAVSERGRLQFVEALQQRMLLASAEPGSSLVSPSSETSGLPRSGAVAGRAGTQYLVAIHRPDHYDPSVAEDDAMGRDIDMLNDQMVAAGVRVFVGGLKSETTAKAVRVQPDGELVVTDGPYLTTDEHVGGFWVLEVADIEDALAWGRKAAIACRAPVEVRPFH